MTLQRMNKTETEKMNKLLEALNLSPDTSVEDLITKIYEEIDNTEIEDTGERDYFSHLDNKKNQDKRDAIIEKLGAPLLTRSQLIKKALEETNKSHTDFINEAVEAHAITLLLASIATGRGVLGGADERIQTAHDKIVSELKAGIYKPRSDVKGDIPVSKLMTEARTSKVTVEAWICRNGLEKTYGLDK